MVLCSGTYQYILSLWTNHESITDGEQAIKGANMSENNVPTVYEWAGGMAAFERLTTIFYRHVLQDPILYPVFKSMPPDHPKKVALWLAEVFGGPKTYTNERGGYPHMVSMHLNRALTEEQRSRWVQLIASSADEAELPSDPEFRSAFIAYLEWGTRIALANSQPGATPPLEAPVPRWGWGEAPPLPPFPDRFSTHNH
jgi:hemoglobin